MFIYVRMLILQHFFILDQNFGYIFKYMRNNILYTYTM